MIKIRGVDTMAGITKVLEENLNGLNVNIFEFDVDEEDGH